ncbi:hypothetical protein P152DRAFT_492508 [Eremomyces bilateralis CBS 781.70]|uniref:Uncharacterized protein n=1 Tax=Eremomyces bilateralis CBS 781.70 TaxID=1392243 RepID=A0A6G1GE21_9PEZI|nr:uncharacterized protein P152DRAFT_492508 [Eremomyces bilateralis CBS 781.70]KAF1816365.1 hypothetical protein P152DRAFT_492508 [Eremomyces bilateralis CBS 781.70]
MPSAPSPSRPHFPAPGRTTTASSSTSRTSIATAGTRLRSASQKLLDADVPLGFMSASGAVVSKAPTLADIRTGGFGLNGWTGEGQDRSPRRRGSGSGGVLGPPSRKATGGLESEPFPVVKEESHVANPEKPAHNHPEHAQFEPQEGKNKDFGVQSITKSTTTSTEPPPGLPRRVTYGYVPPPHVPWTTSTAIALKAFLHWFITPFGFLITLYGLNIVAWGGMLFLLLCNAAPAMCHPSCNDINSPRRIWIEIDSQILNGLFCVTGFGLIPWRFRDLYWWAVWRLGIRGGAREKRMGGIRRLAGIHRGWYRLAGSEKRPLTASAAPTKSEQGVDTPDDLNEALPIPPSKQPDDPLTGVRATPTRPWKMDFVVLMNVANTFLQACLAGFMWGLNRYDRPSWSTGFFVALACIAAAAGGLMIFHEGKCVKKVEGLAPKLDPKPKDVERAEVSNDEKPAIDDRKSHATSR